MANRTENGCTEIKFLNGVWVDKLYSFKPSYERCITDTFSSRVKVHDFQNQGDKAVEDINSWA
ncbi:OLC1v1026077C1 [Oldenlandia corymbosa var. corymbosa]|uniref:OLC1v1026077C1 n=1 Tax=Oldenlandia corymbosa var. corymbosa TaxID=529605 RepID=A0AAV1C660_OLDCO|nr:OLC1v1026077C1 [Oldenlandia corymbosa var. corymbosa]